MDYSHQDNIRTIAEEYGKLKAEKVRIDEAMKKLEPILKEALADKGAVQIGTYTYSVRTQAGRKTLDKSALGEACSKVGIDMDAYYKVGAPFAVMSVKETTQLGDL